MAKYAYKCSDCGLSTVVMRGIGVTTPHPVCRCGNTMGRDFRAELDTHTVVIPGHLRAKTVASDFLPNQQDFEKPGDADGSKGWKAWKDDHVLKREI